MSTTLNLQIVSGADDTESFAPGGWGNGGPTALMGFSIKAGYTKSWSTFRFPTVNIPVGAQIVTASFQPFVEGQAVSTVIYMEAADNPTAPVSDVDLSARPLTAGLLWTVPAAGGARVTSVEIRDLIRDIINRGGWEYGNAMQLHWRPYGGSDGVYTVVRMYEFGFDREAILSVTYVEPSGMFFMMP